MLVKEIYVDTKPGLSFRFVVANAKLYYGRTVIQSCQKRSIEMHQTQNIQEQKQNI